VGLVLGRVVAGGATGLVAGPHPNTTNAERAATAAAQREIIRLSSSPPDCALFLHK